MIRYLLLGGPAGGTFRRTGGCNPWRLRTARGQFTYVLHYFTAGRKRYGVYTLQGSTPPSVAEMQRLIERHDLEAETVEPKAAPVLYVTDAGIKVHE